MPDLQPLLIIVTVTALSLLLYEVWIKNNVSTKGSRLFFYSILALHLFIFLDISFPSELNFMGSFTTFNLKQFDTLTTSKEISKDRFEIIILLIYFTGITIGAIRMVLGFTKIIRLILKSSPGNGKFERIVTTSNFTPCTFFNYILIPFDLPETLCNSVYKHEKYHVDQMHTLDKILWNILSILFWFNPFVHLLKSRQALNLEYDTDQHLIKSIPKADYSEHLLATTFKANGIDFYLMFDGSNIYKRIRRLNESYERKGIWSHMTLVFTFLLLFAGTILAKASFLPTNSIQLDTQISKPEFQPNGYGGYIDSVLQVKVGDKFDNIDSNYRFYLVLNITIDKEGKVIKVYEDNVKTRKGNDLETNNLISDLLKETIRNMPQWIPAKKDGNPVESTVQEEFLFSGQGE